MAKKSKQEKPKPSQLYLYLGLVEVDKGKTRHCYLPVKEGWQEREWPVERPNVWADEIRFYQKRFGFARPGMVISIEHEPEDTRTVYHKTAVRVGSVEGDIAASWQAISDAIKTALDVKKMAKKDGGRDLQLEILEPLRTAYRRLRDKHQRAAFIARVSLYITI